MKLTNSLKVAGRVKMTVKRWHAEEKEAMKEKENEDGNCKKRDSSQG